MKGTTYPRRFKVTTYGDGIVNHAGTAALTHLADVLRLSKAYSAAMAPTRRRRSKHDPGEVLRDLVVMIAGGGDCVGNFSVWVTTARSPARLIWCAAGVRNLGLRRITAGSRIPGNRRCQGVTEGHDGGGN